jgi:hypothetical protein
MNRIVRLGAGSLALAGLLTTAAAAQSLGDYARQQRALKPATPASVKVYTNDNLPTTGMISEVGQPAPPPPAPFSPREAAAAVRAEKQAAEQRTQEEKEWKAKFADQKRTIARLQQEVDTMTRESALRKFQDRANTNAQMYGSAQLAASEQADQAAIAEKQQALDAAKQKLEDMKEELRKASLPAEWAN